MAEGSSDVPVSGTISVYMSSDGDGDVEIEEKDDIASDLTETIAKLSLASCGPCREKDKSTKDARWTCKDCSKHMCDDCNKMHDLFIKGHTVTKIGNKMCDACKQKDDTATEASWYCIECDQHFCNGCNASHGIFLKNHKVRNVASGEKVQGLQKAGKNVKEATGQVRTKQNAKKADKDVGKSSSKTDGGPNTKKDQQDKKANSMSKSPQISPFQQKSLLLNNEKDEMRPKRSIHLKLKTNINFKTDKSQILFITGSAFLPDERLLLVDSGNNTLTVYSHDFQFMEEKVFDQEPRDVAVYDSSEVSVSIYQQGIVRLSLTSGIKEKAYLSVKAAGLAYITENKLGVTQEGPDGFVVISNSGEELLRVQTDGLGKKLFSSPWYVAVDSARSRAYVSGYIMGIVAIELTTGRVDFVYQPEGFTRTQGFDVDQEGYIYICQPYPGKIHRISPTGVNCGIFSDIPVFPFTLCFAPNKRDFIVSDSVANVALYTVV